MEEHSGSRRRELDVNGQALSVYIIVVLVAAAVCYYVGHVIGHAKGRREGIEVGIQKVLEFTAPVP